MRPLDLHLAREGATGTGQGECNCNAEKKVKMKITNLKQQKKNEQRQSAKTVQDRGCKAMKGFVKNNGSRDSQGSLAFKLETMTTVIQSKKWVSDCFNVNDKAGLFSSVYKTVAF